MIQPGGEGPCKPRRPAPLNSIFHARNRDTVWLWCAGQPAVERNAERHVQSSQALARFAVSCLLVPARNHGAQRHEANHALITHCKSDGILVVLHHRQSRQSSQVITEPQKFCCRLEQSAEIKSICGST